MTQPEALITAIRAVRAIRTQKTAEHANIIVERGEWGAARQRTIGAERMIGSNRITIAGDDEPAAAHEI